MSEAIDIEEFLDAPRMRMFRSLGAHLRVRARILACLFVLRTTTSGTNPEPGT